MYKKLKELLIEKRVTQLELAQILKIAPSSLNYKIHGRTDFRVAEAKVVADFLGKSIEEVFVFYEVNSTKTGENA